MIVIALSSAATPVHGQGSGGQGRGFRGPRLQVMVTTAIEHAEELTLNEEQLQRLGTLAEELSEAMLPLTEEMRGLRESGSREGMRELVSKLQEAEAPFTERFEGILSEEQRTALLEYIPTRPRRGGRD